MKDSKINFYKNGYNGSIKIAKNQKVIQVHRTGKSINFFANYKAIENLSSDGYVLYMYLLMHPLDNVWALSSKDVTSRTPLSMRTYNSAVHELIDKGYLVEGDINLKQYSKRGVECGELNFSNDAYHLFEDPDMFVMETDAEGKTVVTKVESVSDTE